MRAKIYVLDASALLAMLNLEKGGDLVARHIDRACISSVNLIEVVTKLVDRGQSLADARTTVGMLALHVEPVDEALAYAASALRATTRGAGLSLGDRVCLALGAKLGAPVLTADTAWAQCKVGVEVTLVR